MAETDIGRRLKALTETLLTAVAYLVLSWLNVLLFSGEAFTPVWPAAGMAVALIFRFGWQAVPGIMIGAFLTEILAFGSPWPMAAVVSVGYGIGPFVSVSGARLFSKHRKVFWEIYDTLIFLLWAVIVHAALTATIVSFGRMLLGFPASGEYIFSWMRVWLAHAAGTILLAPLLLSWFFPEKTRNERNAEYVIMVLATTALSVWIFYFGSHFFMGLPYLLIVPLAWAAIRYSMARAMLLFVFFVMISMSGVALEPVIRRGARFPLAHFTIMSVTYGITLLILATMKRSRDEIIAELKAKREEADRYFTSSLDLLCIADTSGRFLRLNPEWERTLGYRIDEIEGKLFMDFVHPEDVDATRSVLSELSRQHEVISFENRYRCRNGTYRWIEWRSSPRGEIIYAAARDVTDRKKVEEALANERRQLLSVFDSLDHIIYVSDMDSYEILFANRFLIRNLGRDPVGKICYRELQGLDGPCPFCTNETIRKLDPKPYRWEFYNEQIDGYYDIHDRVIDWPDGRKARLELATDITERKKAEEALLTSERKLKTLFESMSEMVALHELVFDDIGNVVDYRILDCNKTYTKVTGVKKEKAVGHLGSEVYGALPPPYLKEFSQVARNGGECVIDEFYAPMGKFFLISVVSPGPNQFATITVDITEQKQAEETIRRMNDQLQSKNKELEQVIYVSSHDLRSPLVNIDGYSRELGYDLEVIQKVLYSDHYGEEQRAEADEALADIGVSLGYIRKSAAQMDVLLAGLLKLSRSGRASLHIATLDMNALMAAIIEGITYLTRNSGAQIHVGPLPACEGDRTAVNQIFTNLIGNAIKYLDPSRSGQIRITGFSENGTSVYTVEDNGIGIEKAHQEKIFEVFHRLEPGKYPGEGLGLTIVRQTLERLDGSISVDSTPGVGSRFIVTLPHIAEK